MPSWAGPRHRHPLRCGGAAAGERDGQLAVWQPDALWAGRPECDAAGTSAGLFNHFTEPQGLGGQLLPGLATGLAGTALATASGLPMFHQG